MKMKDNGEKEAAKKKKELVRLEKEAVKKRTVEEKREMQKAKKDADFEKSRIAMERLQLAWVKTNLTFTALGFTAYKFYYAKMQDGKEPFKYVVSGKELGIFLIIVGFSMLMMATLQHKKKVDQLKMQYEQMQRSISLMLSWLMLSFSVVVILMILFRV
jgi:uncharacterized membrane protein YidH (DUF202 family)